MRSRIPVGVSVGIEPTLPAQLARIEAYLADGYRRVKLKIKPGWDLQVIQAVRQRWPDLLLQVDANSAYTLEDIPVLRQLDQYNLLLIEQPFGPEDMLDHARLQRQVRTPICLDESITSYDHARWALELGACRVINIKVPRVGGLTAARKIHDLCLAQGIPVWGGGMLETNIGRALNLAAAAQAGYTLPGDISASARYFSEDIATPDFVLHEDSTITVPDGVGLGVKVNQKRVKKVCSRTETFTI